MYTVDTYPYDKIKKAKYQARPRGRRKGGENYVYKDLICAFDIETSYIPFSGDQSIMYIWQMQIEDDTIIGRTWKEYERFLYRIQKNMDERERLCVFVHNLSFEFQFLSGVFSVDELFALQRRKVLKYTSGRIEYRCSYIHSNLSLDAYLKKMRVENKKLHDYDYHKLRWPWTPMTDREIEYCVNDVKGLVQAIKADMELEGDDLYSFPLTSTGYVRRDCKRAMSTYNHNKIYDMMPDIELWKICREAFRGGDTHANRFYSERLIKNVKSADRVSSYPDVICNCEFTMSKFEHIGAADNQTLMYYMNKRHKASLMRLALWDVKLRDEFEPSPYLPHAKCQKVYEPVNDNGRILEAKYVETTMTDIDFRIFLEQYNFDVLEVKDLYIAKYGRLPQPLIDMNIKYFKMKTELKGVPGEELMYAKSKEKINAIYGMSAQNPVRRDVKYHNGIFEYDDTTPDETLLEIYNRKSFLCYQWGVWVTAWARYRLFEGIRIAGATHIYNDTDSVKYTGDADFSAFNALRIAESKKNGAYATDKYGKTHYMGVYENDGEYKEFVTMGAKKYCYTDYDDKLHVTVSGVNKKKGPTELEKYGGIKAFKEGFIFREAGGVELIYNDNPDCEIVHKEGTIQVTKNVTVKDSTYTLGLTAEYRQIIEKSRYIIERMRHIY